MCRDLQSLRDFTPIFISNKFECKAIEKDPKGRFIFIKGLLEGLPITFSSIYAPNSAQLQFIENVVANLFLFKEGWIFLGGDLNFVNDVKLDRSWDASLIKQHKQKTAKFDRDQFRGKADLGTVVHKFQLIDVWRSMNPTIHDYTFYYSRFNSYSRIDYVLASSDLTYNIENSDIGIILV